MKKTMFTLAIFFAIGLKSQILLENSYNVNNNNRKSGLTLIKLDLSGEKYFLYNIQSKQIVLYNLNHSIYKTINIPLLSRYRQFSDSTLSIAYLSENLFNNDNLIEYIAFDGQYAPFFQLDPQFCGSMRVFNENGQIIFDGDSIMPSFKRDATYYGYESESKGDFIFNTSNGTKMFLFSYKNNTLSQKVYSLPGTLLCETCGGSTGIIKNNNNIGNNANPYPNPTNGKIIIPYSFNNGENNGKIIICNLEGKTIKEYNIDNTFDKLILDTEEFSSGIYYYNISTKSGVTSGKKIIVVK